jgi:hypothetical protein
MSESDAVNNPVADEDASDGIYKIEASSEFRDLGNDVLKAMCVGVASYFINRFLLKSTSEESLMRGLNSTLISACGLAVYHILLHPRVRFVLKKGDEPYYMYMQRHL